MEPNPQLAALDLDGLVGRPIGEATATVERAGGHVRAVAPGSAVTADYRPDRVTLVVQDGRVVSVFGIG
jgi:Potato inhibitor I family